MQKVHEHKKTQNNPSDLLSTTKLLKLEGILQISLLIIKNHFATLNRNHENIERRSGAQSCVMLFKRVNFKVDILYIAEVVNKRRVFCKQHLHFLCQPKLMSDIVNQIFCVTLTKSVLIQEDYFLRLSWSWIKDLNSSFLAK